MTHTVHLGDCRAVLPTLDDDSVDAVVTDPPYELGFMGRAWDNTGIAYDVDVWREVLRVLKPGGHLLAFGGSRTYHRLACAVEDAGAEIRDQILYLYGSGFPKSHSLGNGWGTALKPAHEPLVLARKPFKGTVAANVAEWGTGGLNIAATRVGTSKDIPASPSAQRHSGYGMSSDRNGSSGFDANIGRWPANLIHDNSPAVLAEFAKAGERAAGSPKTGKEPQAAAFTGTVYGDPARNGVSFAGYNDTGTAARFFQACPFTEADSRLMYTAKASRSERDAGLSGSGKRPDYRPNDSGGNNLVNRLHGSVSRQNHHPTVKPIALCRWLCRLITPPGGVVLDPFAGSGSIGCGAVLEGFSYIGIEMDPEYVQIATARIAYWSAQPRQLGLELAP